MSEEDETEKRLKGVAKSVSDVPPGMTRWHKTSAQESRSTGLWARLESPRAYTQVVLATAALATVTALALVAYHAQQRNPSPAHGNPVVSPTALATSSTSATATPSVTVTVTPSAIAALTTDAKSTPTPVVTPVPQGQTLALTYDNHSQSFVVQVGTTITVHLAPNDKLSDWTLPISRTEGSTNSPPQLTRVSAHNNPDGSVDATFVAEAADSSKIIIASWANGHSTSGDVDFGVAITITP